MPAATTRCLINCQPAPGRPPLRATAGALRRTLGLWLSRLRERRSFPLLSDHDLHDLGVSRWEIDRELRKPFWKG